MQIPASRPGFGSVDERSLGLRGHPIVDILFGLVLGEAVPLLDLSLELVALAVDDVEVIVGKLAPLLLHLTLDLLPVSLDAIPVHMPLLSSGLVTATTLTDRVRFQL